jgi:hypothetical protein
MANIESIPTWEVFMSTAMAENPLLSSEYLGFLIFDYAKFQKEGFQNWIIVQRELNQILQNDVDNPLDFLLNLFRTVIENHKTEFHESEGWDYKRIAFHDERLTEFIGWAKSRFEYLSQDYEKLKQEANKNSEKLKDDNLQPKDLKAPVLARFCELCNDSRLDIKYDDDESNEIYTSRICKKYNLPHNTNVRKHFTLNVKPIQTDKNLKKVIKLILPKINKADSKVIVDFINKHFDIGIQLN